MQAALRNLLAIAIIAMGFSGYQSAVAEASTVKATVDLSQQRMRVYVNGKQRYNWVVSTGKRGWRTKTGSYTPFAQREKFYSSKWRMSMPYVTWIGRDGTAVHGTYLTSKLGRPASHGCIRLNVSNAAKFYRLVEKYGYWSTEVVVRP